MATILEKVNRMLTEKGTKLIPANLKKDVNLWGVTGTLEELNGQTKTVTPTTSQQTVTPDSGYNGITQVTVGAVDNTIDQNIVAGNIKDGVTILGVTGTLEEGIDTSDATATAGDLAENKTAYVNGQKITGTVGVIFSSMDTGATSVIDESTGDPYNDRLVFTLTFNSDTLFREDSRLLLGKTSSAVAQIIGLTANKIKKNEMILGVTGTVQEGTDTSDADATANDLVNGKTAYVNGVKLTGSVSQCEATHITGLPINWNEGFTTADDENNELLIQRPTTREMLYRTGSIPYITIPYAQIATAIGLTADKIKAGVTILGIEGTYNAPADVQQTFSTLNQVLPEAGDTYEGMGATEEEIEEVLDDILGTTEENENVQPSE